MSEGKKTLLFALAFFSMLFANSFYKKSQVLNDPMFTVAEVTGRISGTKGTDYVKYKFKVNSTIYYGEQSLTAISKKRRLKATEGARYLVVYNRNGPKKSHLINVDVTDTLGADLSSQFSLDSLEAEGMISIVNF